MQNPTIAIIIDLHRRIDTHRCRKRLHIPILIRSRHRHILQRLQIIAQPGNIVHLPPRKPQRLGILPIRKLQRQHPHTHQIAAVNAFKTLHKHRAHAQQ